MNPSLKLSLFILPCLFILGCDPKQKTSGVDFNDPIFSRVQVIVWEHANREGDQQGYGCCGTSQATLRGLEDVGNDTISWVRVAPGFRARLCEHEGSARPFGGGFGAGVCQEFTEGEGPVTPNLNDRTSFIQVARVGEEFMPIALVAWSGDNAGNPLEGDAFQVFPTGVFLANRGHLGLIGNDNISRFIVTPGFAVRLCEHEADGEGGGACLDFGEGPHALIFQPIQRSVSFVHVRIIP